MKLPTHLMRSGLAVRSAAGLLDVGGASLASFAVGIFATRTLDPAALGAYALMFSALMFVGTFPTQMVFVPVMAESAKVDWRLRGGYYRDGLRLGGWLVGLSGLALFTVWLLLPSELGNNARAWLVISGATAGMLHPVQLFYRRMLHYEQRSWRAAVVSWARFVLVVASLFGLNAVGVPAIAVPLFGLAVGNLASLLLAVNGSEKLSKPGLSMTQVIERGRYLVGAAALPTGAAFVASQLVIVLAGAQYLGYAEAARTVAVPIGVLGAGLAAAMNPRIMKGASSGNVAVVRRVRRAFWGLVVTGAAVYAAVVLPSWPANFMERLVPVAYDVPGVVAVSVISATLGALVMPLITETIGLNRERKLLRVETFASLFLVALATTAPSTKALARPLAKTGQGIARLSLLSRSARR